MSYKQPLATSFILSGERRGPFITKIYYISVKNQMRQFNLKYACNTTFLVSNLNQTNIRNELRYRKTPAYII